MQEAADIDDIHVEVRSSPRAKSATKHAAVRGPSADSGEYDDDVDNEFIADDTHEGYHATTLRDLEEMKTQVERQQSDMMELTHMLVRHSVDTEFINLANEQDLAMDYSDVIIDANDAKKDPMVAAIKHFKELKEQEYHDLEQRDPLMIDEEDISIIIEEYKESKKVRKWMIFDSVFGVFVLANAILEALSKEGLIDSKTKLSFIVSSCFCCIFILEIAIRWYKVGSFRELVSDTWNVFDIVVVTASILDLWVLGLLDLGSGGAAFAIIRLIRLVRFIRLLRLLREVKTLWLLVQSWAKALPCLCWACVFLWVVAYIIGLLCFELIGQSDHFRNDPQIARYWGDLRRCMLSLAQLCTYDFGAVIMRDVVEGNIICESGVCSNSTNTFGGRLEYTPLFVSVITVFSVGLMNLMVGTVLVSCFELIGLDRTVNTTTEKLLRHKALADFEELIGQKCRDHIGASLDEPCISPDVIYDLLENDEDGRMRDLMKGCNITTEDINSIFNEVLSFQGEHTLVRVHDFVQGCAYIQSEIHQLELTPFLAAAQSMHSRLCMVDEFLDAMIVIMNTAIIQILPGLQEFAADEPPDEDLALAADEGLLEILNYEDLACGLDAQAVHRLTIIGLAEAEVESMSRAKKMMQHSKIWAKFDSFFLVIVFANAICLGIDSAKEVEFKRNFVSDTLEGDDYMWLLVESFFGVTFIVEIFLRVGLFYQLKVMDSTVVIMYIFPQIVFDGSLGVWWRILKEFPNLFAWDKYVIFDALLIAICLIDNLILRFFFRKISYIIILRVFRGLRVLRIARMLYLMHDLQVLVSTLRLTAPIVCWNIVLLSGILYLASIFCLAVIQPEFTNGRPSASAETMAKWNGLVVTYYNLWKLSTFTDWGASGKELAYHTQKWVYMFVLFIALFTGLGVIKIGTGIVIQQSFKSAADQHATHKLHAGARMKKVGVQCLRTMFKRLEAHYLHAKHNRKERGKELMRSALELWRSTMPSVAVKVRKSTTWTRLDGCITGDDTHVQIMTVENAKLRCFDFSGCRGFSHAGVPTSGQVQIHFKSTSLGQTTVAQDPQEKWTTYMQESAVTFIFRPGQLGIEAVWDIGYITKVIKGGQAAEHGVKDGWQIIRVDGHDYTQKLLERYKKLTKPYLVSFETQAARPEGLKDKAISGKPEPKTEIGPQVSVFGRISGSLSLLSHGSKSSKKSKKKKKQHDDDDDQVVSSKSDAFKPITVMHSPEEIMGNVVKAVQCWSSCDREPQKVDESTLSSHGLMNLLLDPVFRQQLEHEGVRPDLIIMLFQRLDILKEGRIDVTDFTDGLQRLMYPVSGLDVACAKSIARRLYSDALDMVSESSRMQEGFLNICCRLRGITPVGNHGGTDFNEEEHVDAVMDVSEEVNLLAKEAVSLAKSARLRKKIENAQEHLETCIRISVGNGDIHVGVKLHMEEGAMEEDRISITSAREGND